MTGQSLFELQDFQQIAAMEGHKGVVSALLVEGQILYSGSWDGTIRLWWRPDHTALVHLGGASTLHLGGIRALSSAAGLLFAAYDSGIIQVSDRTLFIEETCAVHAPPKYACQYVTYCSSLYIA